MGREGGCELGECEVVFIIQVSILGIGQAAGGGYWARAWARGRVGWKWVGEELFKREDVMNRERSKKKG